MLISKFDLYKPEWLELVFNNRNKDYGAYDLRQHYADNMVRAMGITFFGVALLFGASVIFRSRPVPIVQTPHDPVITVTLHPSTVPLTPPRRIDPPRATEPVKTTQFIPFVVKQDQDVKTSPTPNTQITSAIGPTTTPGSIVDPGPIEEATPGTGTQPAPDNKVYNPAGLDVMPQPVGGEKAWAKFLSKNLRYPGDAQQEGASGRVYLSFIIEKDGNLSNILVDRAAGHGFDEEALRVLKMAKAWKPGMQNGQPVRVRFSIPINFQSSSEN